MITVTVQIKQPSLTISWEEVEKVEHTFKTWKEVSTFAYRLTIQFNKEVRVEHKGQGYYYIPNNANNFLSL